MTLTEENRSTGKTGFDSWSAKWHCDKLFSAPVGLAPVSIIPPMLHIRISFKTVYTVIKVHKCHNNGYSRVHDVGATAISLCHT
jgi:hypothetical protein